MADLELIINGNPIKATDFGNERSIEEIAIEVTGRAKPLAPKDKGQLRGSIMYKTSKTEGGYGEEGTTTSPPIDVDIKDGEGYVGTNTEYAVYQEFGTKKMKPQPFLRPAIALTQNPSIKEEIKKILNNEMSKELPKAK